jgi:isopentenyl diphosphate isomerase/L-lactate dehydrogenase-like FMN-dependent dehydrogenase
MPAADFCDVAELERIATARWSSGLRSFIQGGAGNGDGVRANRLAHARWSLRARVLVDVSSIDTSTTVLGIPVGLPVMIAPSGLHTLVLPEGEVATAQGARDANTVMVLSSGTGRSIEDVTAVGGNVWFQLYWGSDRTQARRLIDLAGENGCRALADTMTVEDALIAADSGIDAIIVSNHGGRALDTPVGTMDVLPSIAAALDQVNEVYVDGGFRHGSEVLAALALGARGVLIGRPALWALAVGGARGVTSLLELIGHELASVMARVGSASIAGIDATRVSAVTR